MDKDLIRKFFNDQCDAAEKSEVIKWMGSPENKLLLSQWLDEHWQELNVSTRPDIKLDHIWQKIALEKQLPETGAVLPEKKTTIRWWYAMAAALLLFTVGGLGIQFLNSDQKPLETVYKTEYGQVMKIRLPDQSEVTLNGNSSIRIKETWSDQQPREVWLDGEGFFSVKHTVNHQKFIVYANENVGVEVLGTEFSVSDWKEKTRVVLNSGKIQLHLKENQLEQQIEMKPGDLAEFDNTKVELVRLKVNPEVYSSWRNQSLVFDNTPLSEVSKRIEETYGIDVTMDSVLYSKRLTGKVSIENLDVLLEAMANGFQLKIHRTETQITMQPK